jgi:hypothetical protein
MRGKTKCGDIKGRIRKAGPCRKLHGCDWTDDGDGLWWGGGWGQKGVGFEGDRECREGKGLDEEVGGVDEAGKEDSKRKNCWLGLSFIQPV